MNGTNGQFIDTTITQEELLALWDVRGYVFTFHAEFNRLPKSYDDLCAGYKELTQKHTDKHSIHENMLKELKSLPVRLHNLRLQVTDDTNECLVSFTGTDKQLHAYNPYTPQYPTSIS